MTRKKPTITEADGGAIVSWCVSVTAALVKELETEGHCTPELYESLKGVQLLVDRHVHKLEKSGVVNRLGQYLPTPPDTGGFDNLSPPKIMREKLSLPAKGN